MNANESRRPPAEMLTVEQVARLLQVSQDTIYRLAARGELPGRKIGNLWRFSERKVRAWSEARHVSELGSDAAGEETTGTRPEAQEYEVKASLGSTDDANQKAPRQ